MSDQQIVMNISEETTFLSGFCDLKCDFSFHYNSSVCYVYPNSANTSLQFTYESNSNGTNQVLYNGIEYNVSGVFIYSPSLHYFGGNQANAEIQIVHQAVLGNGLPLVVCIPIITLFPNKAVPNINGTSLVEDMINYAIPRINIIRQTENDFNNEISTANTELTNLKNNRTIESGSGIANFGNKIKNSFDNLGRKRRKEPTKSAPPSIENQLSSLQDQLQRVKNQVDNNLNQPQVTNVTNYRLDYLVPSKYPFFSYTNTNDNAYYIVYGTDNAIFVDSDVIQNLQSFISPYYTNPTYSDTIVSPNTTANIYPLFKNNTGATSLLTTDLSDEIYIDCQPTGSSNEQMNVTTATTTTLQKSSTLFFIYVIFFLFVLFLIYMIFSYISHPDKKNFSIGNMKNPFV